MLLRWASQVILVVKNSPANAGVNQDQGTKETVHWLLHDIWPELVRGLLQTGKSELEKQGQPAFFTSCPPLHSGAPYGVHIPLSITGRGGDG